MQHSADDPGGEAPVSRAGVPALAGPGQPDRLKPGLQPSDGAQSVLELLTALEAVGEPLGVTFREPVRREDLLGAADPVEVIARASRLRFRRLRLVGAWDQADCGPLLGYLPEAQGARPVALLPRSLGGYEIVDSRTATRERLTPAMRAQLQPEAVQFYRSFPDRALSLGDLVGTALTPFRRELLAILGLMLLVTLLGMLLPITSRWIIDRAIPDANRPFLIELTALLIAANLGQALFLLAQGVVTLRVQTGGTVLLQAALWDRILRLAPSFFRQHTSGDLLNRAQLLTELSRTLSGTVLRSMLMGCLALLNVFLLLYYSVRLTLVAVVAALLCAALTWGLAQGIRRLSVVIKEGQGRLFGFVVQTLQGLGKLRTAGAQRRVYERWARRNAELVGLEGKVKRLEDIHSVFVALLPTLASLALFPLALPLLRPTTPGAAPLTLGSLVAFLTAFGAFLGGAVLVGRSLMEIAETLSQQTLLRPLLTAEPEITPQRVDPGPLQGTVAVVNVIFHYHSAQVASGGRVTSFPGPLVLQGVTLTAQPGEFIAIVGPSGSGKSTLLRLLLGFEKPESGAILYDGRDLSHLDLVGVRRQLGVVLQSAHIFSGSLFDNIAAGHLLRPEEVLQAAHDAALAEDLERMPMGLHTVVSEGGRNLSGGQRQRLLIARALAAGPKILLLDEATSFLDNRTQAHVTASLNRRRVTRIVIAHRLSTIQNADRIYVLDHGQIVQTGSFNELAAREGLFRRLMERQSLKIVTSH